MQIVEKTHYGSRVPKASEIVAELQKLIEEHGDLPVFAAMDYEWVTTTSFVAHDAYDYEHGDHFELCW